MEQVRARIAQRGAGPADQPEGASAAVVLPPAESFGFDGGSIYRSSRGRGVGRVLYRLRMLLAPLVKLVFNVDPMVDALAAQARRNAQQASFDDDVARRLAAREDQDELTRRALRSLTAEVTRLAADMRDQRELLESAADLPAAGAKRNARPASFDDDAARRSAADRAQDETARRSVRSSAAIVERPAVETKSRRTPPESADERHGAVRRVGADGDEAGPHGPRPSGAAETSAPAARTSSPNR